MPGGWPESLPLKTNTVFFGEAFFRSFEERCLIEQGQYPETVI
ncbi:hypothetical protein SXCC_04090 [Gluconacetobacter sp. SXCC-1]|nr:hypothetical protein SXCC_04090 [Gluconacetobacter sp. SXCC-1]